MKEIFKWLINGIYVIYCNISDNILHDVKDVKVSNHSYVTGKYKGPVHQSQC